MTLTTSSFDIGALTDKGRKRKDNQDAFVRADAWLTDEQRDLRERYGRLYIVADGVGGNDDGDVASKMVVDGVMEHFYTTEDPQAPTDPLERLRMAIERTSREINQEAGRRKNNMASTIVAALIYDNKLTIANIGDSPALLLRPGQAPKQLSVDHIHKDRRGEQSLSQSMGDAEVSIAFFTTDFQADDVVVLCSDGLTDLVKPEEIKRVIGQSSARDATRDLIRLANARGGHDNITALVVRNGKVPLLQQKRVLQTALAGVGTLVGVALLVMLVSVLFKGGTEGLSTSPGSDQVSFARATIAAGGGGTTSALIEVAPPTVTPEPSNTAAPAPATNGPAAQRPSATRPAGAPTEVPLPSATPTTPAPVVEPPPEGKRMPELVGKSEQEARALLKQLGIDNPVYAHQQSRSKLGSLFDQFPAGAVVSTQPRTGELIEPGVTITLGIRAATDDTLPPPPQEPVTDPEPSEPDLNQDQPSVDPGERQNRDPDP